MKKQSVKCLATWCIALATLFALNTNTTSAQTQAQYVAQVRAQLNVVRDAVEDNGYVKTHDYKISTLGRGRKDSFTLDLRKGRQYILVSVCDQDCSDLDIKVFDENNNQIASDTAVDDRPVVSVTPRWTGEFRIQVTMYKCSNSPCYYGIGVFGN